MEVEERIERMKCSRNVASLSGRSANLLHPFSDYSLESMYTSGWREALWEKECFAQEHNTRKGLEAQCEC